MRATGILTLTGGCALCEHLSSLLSAYICDKNPSLALPSIGDASRVPQRPQIRRNLLGGDETHTLHVELIKVV